MNQGPLILRIDSQALAKTLTASVSEIAQTEVLQSHALLPVHPFQAKNPAPQAGQYTMLLAGSSLGDNLGPSAPGYGAGTVKKTGATTIIGKLADGTPLSLSALVRADGTLALYGCLYGKKSPFAGEITGYAILDPTPQGTGVTGTLAWRKPAQPAGTFWPLGFEQTVEMDGSVYTPPKPGVPLVDLPGNALFEFTADRDPLVASTLSINPSNQFIFASPNVDHLSLILTKKTGVLHGSFQDPLTRLNRKMEGVVLQSSKEFGGFYFQDGVTGGWSVQLSSP
jgi:hypothetical protein